MKIIFLFLSFFFSVFLANSQITIEGNITSPEGYAWVILYGYSKGEQKLVSKSTITKEGHFAFTIKKDSLVTGVYRLTYHQAKKQYVDVLLENKKNVCITIDPLNITKTVHFCGNSANAMLEEYETLQQPLLTNISILYDLIQNYSKNTELYALALLDFDIMKQEYLANAEIFSRKNNLLKQYLSFKTPYFPKPTDHSYLQKYYAYENYFTNYNVLDSVFLNSPTLQNVVVSYLGLQQEEGSSKEASINQYKKNIDNLMLWAQKNEVLQLQIAENISFGFKQMDLEELTQYIDENYLAEQCDADLDKELQERLAIYKRLAIGKKAPDFVIPMQNKQAKTLYKIEADYTIVLFWGSWCEHCKSILPAIHNFTSSKEKIKVIAFGLDPEEQNWLTEKELYPNWSHIRLAEKWNDPIPLDYGIYATPTFFVLDKDKKILGKCKNLLEIKNLF